MEADSVDSRRTVVVSGVPDVLPVDRMIDKLTIHFQSCRRSFGGDVEVVKFPTNVDGVAFVTFDRAEDAKRVVKKEQQIMVDGKFPQDYNLTVFPFSSDVYLYVPRAVVDLSIFGSDQASLIGSLQSAHRSIRFQSMPQQRKAIVEGPFSAVQALREDLIRRASRFKPSALHATVQQGQTSNHHGPVSSRSPKTNRGLASPRSKSVSQQRTGEVQSSFSKAKSPNTSLRQKVSDEGLDGASSFNAYNSQESTKYRTEGPETSLREVEGEETKPVFASSFSNLDPLPLEETSAKQQREESFSGKHSREDGISAGNDLISHYSSMNSSSSLVDTKLPKSGRTPVSTFIKSDVGGNDGLPSEDSGDIWLDLYTFKYIERFCKKDLERCLECVDMVFKCVNEETGLVCISLTQKQTFKASSALLSSTMNYLKTLMKSWQLRLRVHEIFYNKAGWPNTQKLIQICDEGKMLYHDVLYILEDSCIKVIGPSESSHLFSRRVEDEITKHKRRFPRQ